MKCLKRMYLGVGEEGGCHSLLQVLIMKFAIKKDMN